MKKISLIKIGLLITFFLLISSTVLANSVSIVSSSEFPSGTNWSAIIDFSLNPLNELRVFLDDELIVTVFEYNEKIFVDSDSSSKKLVGFDVEDSGRIFLSIMGLSKGNYSLKAKIFVEGKQIKSDSKKVVFFNLNEKISSLENTVFSQNNLISSLKEDLNKKNTELVDLRNQNNFLQKKIIELDSNISLLKESNEVKEDSLKEIRGELIKLSGEKNTKKDSNNNFFGTNFAGLFGLSINPFSVIGLIGLICLIIIGVIIYQEKFKEKRLYG